MCFCLFVLPFGSQPPHDMDNSYNGPCTVFILFKIVPNYQDLYFLTFVLSNVMPASHLHLSFHPSVLSLITLLLKNKIIGFSEQELHHLAVFFFSSLLNTMPLLT